METKTARSPAIYLLLAVITLGIAAGVIFSVLAYHSSSEALRVVEERLPQEDTETREDNVTIAGQYVIRSTKDISDAYKSGDASALDNKQRETLDMASGVLEQVITGGMTPFEQEKAVYDWMTANLQRDRGLLTVIPTTQADCDNPYGVLKYHNAVCVGYATTFRLFMEMLDIPCMVVHNQAEHHSWDLVQLDGAWYHTDIYSDVGRGNYACFNLDDAMMGRNQEWNRQFFPAANSLEHNMAYLNSVEGPGVLELPALLRKALDDKTPMLSFRYDGGFTEAEARKTAEAVEQVRSLLWNVSEFNGANINDYGFSPLKDGYLLTISYYFPDEEEEPISEEEREQIQQAVNQTFADVTGWVDETEWTEDGGPDEFIQTPDVPVEKEGPDDGVG